MPSSHLAPGGGARGGNPILVVEDDPSILEMVVQILQDEGYPVVSATNGADGLAETNRTRPSLILLDMRMPRMDGWEFAAALRARGIAAPIVVMTAAEDAKKWADEVGARATSASLSTSPSFSRPSNDTAVCHQRIN
jgi:CheY-like chemotaxis protein